MSPIIEEFSAGTKVTVDKFYNKPSTWAICSGSIVSTISGVSTDIGSQAHGQMLKVSISAHSWGDEVFTGFNGIVSNAFETTDFEYLYVRIYTDWNSKGNFTGKGIVFGAGSNRIIVGNSGWYVFKITKTDWENEQKFYITPYNDYGNNELSFNVYFDEIYYSEETGEEFTYIEKEIFDFDFRNGNGSTNFRESW